MEQPVESQELKGRDTKEEPVKQHKILLPTKCEEWGKEMEAQQAGGKGPAPNLDKCALSEDEYLALEEYTEMEDVHSRINPIAKKLWENEAEFSTLIDRLNPKIHDIRDNEEVIRSTFDRIITIRDEKKRLGQELGQLYEERRRIQLKVNVGDKERRERHVRGPFENIGASIAITEEPRTSMNSMKTEETEKEP